MTRYAIPPGAAPCAPASARGLWSPESETPPAGQTRLHRTKSWFAEDPRWRLHVMASYYRSGDFLCCEVPTRIELFCDGECYFAATLQQTDTSMQYLEPELPSALLTAYSEARRAAEDWFQAVAATDPAQVSMVEPDPVRGAVLEGADDIPF